MFKKSASKEEPYYECRNSYKQKSPTSNNKKNTIHYVSKLLDKLNYFDKY